MPDIVDFPTGLRISDRTDPMLVSASRSPGAAINGFEQVISPLSQRWEWTVSIPVFTAAHARSLRILLAQANGRFNYIRMRICDQYRMSASEIDAAGGGFVPHSDDAPFSDGSEYHGGVSTPLGVNMQAGETSVTIDPGFTPSAGVFFSINDWLYVIDKVDDPIADETARTVHFSPPLNEGALVGDEFNFDAICLWRLATDREGLANLQQGKFGVVTLNLVEPIGR